MDPTKPKMVPLGRKRPAPNTTTTTSSSTTTTSSSSSSSSSSITSRPKKRPMTIRPISSSTAAALSTTNNTTSRSASEPKNQSAHQPPSIPATEPRSDPKPVIRPVKAMKAVSSTSSSTHSVSSAASTTSTIMKTPRASLLTPLASVVFSPEAVISPPRARTGALPVLSDKHVGVINVLIAQLGDRPVKRDISLLNGGGALDTTELSSLVAESDPAALAKTLSVLTAPTATPTGLSIMLKALMRLSGLIMSGSPLLNDALPDVAKALLDALDLGALWGFKRNPCLPLWFSTAYTALLDLFQSPWGPYPVAAWARDSVFDRHWVDLPPMVPFITSILAFLPNSPSTSSSTTTASSSAPPPSSSKYSSAMTSSLRNSLVPWIEKLVAVAGETRARHAIRLWTDLLSLPPARAHVAPQLGQWLSSSTLLRSSRGALQALVTSTHSVSPVDIAALISVITLQVPSAQSALKSAAVETLLGSNPAYPLYALKAIVQASLSAQLSWETLPKAIEPPLRFLAQISDPSPASSLGSMIRELAFTARANRSGLRQHLKVLLDSPLAPPPAQVAAGIVHADVTALPNPMPAPEASIAWITSVLDVTAVYMRAAMVSGITTPKVALNSLLPAQISSVSWVSIALSTLATQHGKGPTERDVGLQDATAIALLRHPLFLHSDLAYFLADEARDEANSVAIDLLSHASNATPALLEALASAVPMIRGDLVVTVLDEVIARGGDWSTLSKATTNTLINLGLDSSLLTLAAGAPSTAGSVMWNNYPKLKTRMRNELKQAGSQLGASLAACRSPDFLTETIAEEGDSALAWLAPVAVSSPSILSVLPRQLIAALVLESQAPALLKAAAEDKDALIPILLQKGAAGRSAISRIIPSQSSSHWVDALTSQTGWDSSKWLSSVKQALVAETNMDSLAKLLLSLSSHEAFITLLSSRPKIIPQLFLTHPELIALSKNLFSHPGAATSMAPTDLATLIVSLHSAGATSLANILMEHLSPFLADVDPSCLVELFLSPGVNHLDRVAAWLEPQVVVAAILTRPGQLSAAQAATLNKAISAYSEAKSSVFKASLAQLSPQLAARANRVLSGESQPAFVDFAWFPRALPSQSAPQIPAISLPTYSTYPQDSLEQPTWVNSTNQVFTNDDDRQAVASSLSSIKSPKGPEPAPPPPLDQSAKYFADPLSSRSVRPSNRSDGLTVPSALDAWLGRVLVALGGDAGGLDGRLSLDELATLCQRHPWIVARHIGSIVMTMGAGRTMDLGEFVNNGHVHVYEGALTALNALAKSAPGSDGVLAIHANATADVLGATMDVIGRIKSADQALTSLVSLASEAAIRVSLDLPGILAGTESVFSNLANLFTHLPLPSQAAKAVSSIRP